MLTGQIQKQATIFLAVLLLYSMIYIIICTGGLLKYSFFEPGLMINNQFTAGHVSDAIRWKHFLVWLPSNICGIYACLAGVYITYLCRDGQFFTSKFARGLRHVGYAVLFSAITDILATSAVPHILSSLNPAGQLPFHFRFSPEEFGLILCGFGLTALGQMMGEATRLSDENKSFV